MAFGCRSCAAAVPQKPRFWKFPWMAQTSRSMQARQPNVLFTKDSPTSGNGAGHRKHLMGMGVSRRHTGRVVRMWGDLLEGPSALGVEGHEGRGAGALGLRCQRGVRRTITSCPGGESRPRQPPCLTHRVRSKHHPTLSPVSLCACGSLLRATFIALSPAQTEAGPTPAAGPAVASLDRGA